MIAVDIDPVSAKYDHPLVEQFFIILTAAPAVDENAFDASEAMPAGLPREWGEVLYILPDRGHFMVQIRGWNCAGFDPSEQRLVRIDEMRTWVWFDDEEDMKYEFDGTYRPRLEMWALEQQWAWQQRERAKVQSGNPTDHGLIVRKLSEVGDVETPEAPDAAAMRQRLEERRRKA